MSPLDCYIKLCRDHGESPEGRMALRLAHDNFVHAEAITRHLDRAGLPVATEVVMEDSTVTIVIVVDAPPPALVEALDDGGLAHSVYDFACDHQTAYAVYHVQAHGCTLPIVAHTKLVDREDRAALLSKKAA